MAEQVNGFLRSLPSFRSATENQQKVDTTRNTSLHRKHRGHATERCVLNYVVISREVVWVKEAINSPLVFFFFFAKERETNGGGGGGARLEIPETSIERFQITCN